MDGSWVNQRLLFNSSTRWRYFVRLKLTHSCDPLQMVWISRTFSESFRRPLISLIDMKAHPVAVFDGINNALQMANRLERDFDLLRGRDFRRIFKSNREIQPKQIIHLKIIINMLVSDDRRISNRFVDNERFNSKGMFWDNVPVSVVNWWSVKWMQHSNLNLKVLWKYFRIELRDLKESNRNSSEYCFFHCANSVIEILVWIPVD